MPASQNRGHRSRGAEDAPTAESWARRLQRGDPAAVVEVRERVSRILAYGPLSIPEQERADLEQEVMTDVWRAMSRPDFDVAAGFWGFVEVVASRRCIDWLRSRRETSSLLPHLQSRADSPFQAVVRTERKTLASNVLASLDPACRELVTLRFRDNLSYGEISELQGKSEGALRVQAYRCIRYARRVLKRLVETGGQP